MTNNIHQKTEAFERILKIMDELRTQCPWDRKQTLESLRPLTIEETYELSDAILKQDMNGIKEELGDLLLHLVFYAKIAEEKEAFDIAEIINGLCEKLIARHPHIYGNVKVNNEEDVKQNWEKLKLKEGKKSVLAGVPDSLPPLIKSYRIQDKAAQAKFDWKHHSDVWKKVEEEITEFQAEVQVRNKEKMEAEFGDLLFTLVNYARFVQIDPEAALERANHKFIRRFKFMEQKAVEADTSLHEMSLDEMDTWWNEAKKQGL